MNEVEQDRSKRIVEALASKGVDRTCPRCGNAHFSVVAETYLQINSNPTLIVGGYRLPTVIVACNNCGFITQHALGPLDIPVEESARAG